MSPFGLRLARRLLARARGRGTLDGPRGLQATGVLDQLTSLQQVLQTLVLMRVREMAEAGRGPLPLDRVHVRVFSQNGEDGVLLWIFGAIGMTNRRAVEIAAGDGIECNSANLIINHGWTGLLVDGDADNVRRGREFYARCRDTAIWPPVFVHAWVTKDRVNQLLRDHGFVGEIDLLALDLDGVDYWIWEALDCVTPRVVVVEYQDIWGPDAAVTVPYRDDFRAEFGPYGPEYAGASLGAFVKLGRQKGYRLVGCERYGFNAFFVRRGLAEDVLPEIAPAECFKHPKVQHGMRHRLPNVRGREWQEV
jgi:hypothetical protein